MRDIAGEAIRATAVGARGTIRPDKGDSLADFQAVVAEAYRLEAAAVIRIESSHSESMSSNRYVDSIMFGSSEIPQPEARSSSSHSSFVGHSKIRR